MAASTSRSSPVAGRVRGLPLPRWWIARLRWLALIRTPLIERKVPRDATQQPGSELFRLPKLFEFLFHAVKVSEPSLRSGLGCPWRYRSKHRPATDVAPQSGQRPRDHPTDCAAPIRHPSAPERVGVGVSLSAMPISGEFMAERDKKSTPSISFGPCISGAWSIRVCF